MQLENIKSRMEKIEKYKKKTYDNYMDDLISRDDYKKYVTEYDKEIGELKQQQELINSKTDLEKEISTQYDEWVEAFINYVDIDKLTREIVIELIEKIEVNKDGSINIYYKFRNPYIS